MNFSYLGNMSEEDFLEKANKIETKEKTKDFIENYYAIIIKDEQKDETTIRYTEKPILDNLKKDLFEIISIYKNEKDKFTNNLNFDIVDLKVSSKFETLTEDEFDRLKTEEEIDFYIGGDFVVGENLFSLDKENTENYLNISNVIELINEDGMKNLANSEIKTEINIKIGKDNEFHFKAKNLKDGKFSIEFTEQDFNLFIDKVLKYTALNDGFCSDDFYCKNITCEYNSYQSDCEDLTTEEKFEKLNEIKSTEKSDILSKEIEELKIEKGTVEIKADFYFYNDDRISSYELKKDNKTYLKLKEELELQTNFEIAVAFPEFVETILNEYDKIEKEEIKEFEKN